MVRRRIYVEKKPAFRVEAEGLLTDLKENLSLTSLANVRLLSRYDVTGAVSEDVFQEAKRSVFSEPPVDFVYEGTVPLEEGVTAFAKEPLPGQYDQRADSAEQCLKILDAKATPAVTTATVFLLEGPLTEEELQKVKNYLINPLDARETAPFQELPEEDIPTAPEAVEVLEGFRDMDEEDRSALLKKLGLAMHPEDLAFIQTHFKEDARRDPTLTELRVLDTYWSDHCRHTTFLTRIEEVTLEENAWTAPMKATYATYLAERATLYGPRLGEKPVTLMDMATIGAKLLRKEGGLQDLEESEEINAASFHAKVENQGALEDWIIMFKNETHNHPTEIEPFGGAATCLGGAIRDPLSGRSYVFGSLRVTGSADPREALSDTLAGKLPQRKITREAARGFSSYGNQIGLATGQVAEVYDEGYKAKRMELGAVVAAAPRKNVRRESPIPGDVVVLVGGRTGRDGLGGATGSSKEHDATSLHKSGAEVQKGNPVTERKLQRLFRRGDAATLIKKSNDFGAGGVAVAIGELAEGLRIHLDVLPVKYQGLDGTELAIAESQERMAVVLSPADADPFIALAQEENLEALVVAEVTEAPRLVMEWKGQAIVDLPRAFLDTNGVERRTAVTVTAPPSPEEAPLEGAFTERLLKTLSDLNVCSQKGLIEHFDSTIGAGSLLLPLGGRNQLTPAEGLAMRVPLAAGPSQTAVLMTYGAHPERMRWSPYHGAYHAVVESLGKIAALGGNPREAKLSFQEYFERLGEDPKRWGKPFAALLGAYQAQRDFQVAAIGGKDSMSGSFLDLDVPPTLVSFAVATVEAKAVLSPEFKAAGQPVYLLKTPKSPGGLPDAAVLKRHFKVLETLGKEGRIASAAVVKTGGWAAQVAKMALGSGVGFTLQADIDLKDALTLPTGAFLVALTTPLTAENTPAGFTGLRLGTTTAEAVLRFHGEALPLTKARAAFEAPLSKVFPVEAKGAGAIQALPFHHGKATPRRTSTARPRVLLPVFPGTNCEFDTRRAFEGAGAEVEELLFLNQTPVQVEASLKALEAALGRSQILMLPGGFSGGDEPDGSGKFIAAAFRNPRLREAVEAHLTQQDGLILGICNGFQALVKLGLLPHGTIRPMTAEDPTLTFNHLGRHLSTIASVEVVSTKSPWLLGETPGAVHQVALSHGEGRFHASEKLLAELAEAGQIATIYHGMNPNGSSLGIEGILSPDGRVFGKMGHIERYVEGNFKNVPGNYHTRIIESGVAYYR